MFFPEPTCSLEKYITSTMSTNVFDLDKGERVWNESVVLVWVRQTATSVLDRNAISYSSPAWKAIGRSKVWLSPLTSNRNSPLVLRDTINIKRKISSKNDEKGTTYTTKWQSDLRPFVDHFTKETTLYHDHLQLLRPHGKRGQML